MNLHLIMLMILHKLLNKLVPEREWYNLIWSEVAAAMCRIMLARS